MSIKKQFSKSKEVCKVTFTVAKETADGAKQISVLGDFNGWTNESNPLKKQKDGSFRTSIDLENGKTYQFRYLVDNTSWANDEEADDHVPSGIAQELNCVISTVK